MRGRVPREQVGEKPRRVAQERALTLHAARLLKEREHQDLGVRESLEAFVTLRARVEVLVGVVDQAEQNGDRLFRPVEPSGKVGYLLLLVEGSRMAPFLSHRSTQYSFRG